MKIPLFIFFLFLLAALPLTRFFSGQPLLAGTLPYHHLRIAETFHDLFFQDPSITGSRLISITPYHLLLSFFTTHFNSTLTLLILTGLLHLASFLILANILNNTPRIRHLCSYFLFLYTTSTPVLASMLNPTPLAFCIFLYLSAISAFTHKKSYLSSLLFFVLSLHGFIETSISITTLYFLQRLNRQQPTFLFFFLIFYLLAFSTPLFFFAQTPTTETSSFIAEFGGLMSESIMLLLLAFIGILFIWT